MAHYHHISFIALKTHFKRSRKSDRPQQHRYNKNKNTIGLNSMARKDSNTKKKAISPSRRVKALKLRQKGVSYRDIASQLKCSLTTAYSDVKKMIDQINQEAKEEAEMLRTLELLRLDEAQAAIWEKAISGDLKAIAVILKISDQRCKLLGLYQQPTSSPKEGIKELEAIKVLVESNWLSEDLQSAIASHIIDCSMKIKEDILKVTLADEKISYMN
ncbi:hypothetical protein [Aphanothece hegewaldii]|nr:hypothetical protein [Aphanothece hegewaldii]